MGGVSSVCILNGLGSFRLLSFRLLSFRLLKIYLCHFAYSMNL